MIRNKQHLACLRPYDGLLVLETMYYADEVRKPEKIDGKVTLRKPELEMAKSLVENLSEPFDPTKYDDTYRVDLMAALRESVERTQKKQKTQKRAARKKPARRAS